MILFAIMFVSRAPKACREAKLTRDCHQVYFWFPNTIAQFLSYFNWMTWIAPDNVALSVVTGSVNGLGLNPLPTFDWNMVVFNGDPLVLPFYNILSGVVGMFIGLPIILAVSKATWLSSRVTSANVHARAALVHQHLQPWLPAHQLKQDIRPLRQTFQH